MTTTRFDTSVDPRSLGVADNGRKALHAYVSDDAHDDWHSYAAEQGVSVSAILEALPRLGLLSLDEHPELVDRRVAAVMTDVVKIARKIDTIRRRRRAR